MPPNMYIKHINKILPSLSCHRIICPATPIATAPTVYNCPYPHPLPIAPFPDPYVEQACTFQLPEHAAWLKLEQMLLALAAP